LPAKPGVLHLLKLLQKIIHKTPCLPQMSVHNPVSDAKHLCRAQHAAPLLVKSAMALGIV
jgi:hypothetical protein